MDGVMELLGKSLEQLREQFMVGGGRCVGRMGGGGLCARGGWVGGWAQELMVGCSHRFSC